ncbi:hypothetical protein [Actinocorallia sp. A-T 12471]|uniref:hypothetical protein n=1 Tax=Actinocorallia sp. A-T 12471 TaxID=3089813 RepID=UPI0029D2909D|nr:hypothetical protein [Actinocorallia sp. A-T 12471]MDX6743831.1 hypothetical protein [Actinocorallia sp. A-T 12471]
MTVTLKDVLDRLMPEEVDYPAAAALGPGALPYLTLLARGSNVPLAAKAVYLAGRMGAGHVLADAAREADPRLRVAAAACLAWASPETAARLAVRLRDDPDPGVRKHAGAAVSGEKDSANLENP